MLHRLDLDSVQPAEFLSYLMEYKNLFEAIGALEPSQYVIQVCADIQQQMIRSMLNILF